MNGYGSRGTLTVASEASDWSDPREPSPRHPTIDKQPPGLQVPDLLQNFFGIDYLPYNNSNNDDILNLDESTDTRTEAADEDDEERHTDDAEEEKKKETGEEERRQEEVSRDLHNGDSIANINDDGDLHLGRDLRIDTTLLDVALEVPSSTIGNDVSNESLTEDVDIFNELSGSSQRTRRGPDGRRIKKAFGNIKSRVKKVKEKRKERKERKLSLDLSQRGARKLSEEVALEVVFMERDTPTSTSANGTQLEQEQLQSQFSNPTVLAELQRHKSALSSAQALSEDLRKRANEASMRIGRAQLEIAELEKRLVVCLSELQTDVASLAQLEESMSQIEQQEAQGKAFVELVEARLPPLPNSPAPLSPLPPPVETFGTPTPRRQRGKTEDLTATPRTPRTENMSGSSKPGVFTASGRARSYSTPNLRHTSTSFMRVHDLDIPDIRSQHSTPSSDTSSLLTQTVGLPTDLARETAEDFFFIDDDIPRVLEALYRLGFSVVTDESNRFVPLQGTDRLLQKKLPSLNSSWPISPWHTTATESDVLVWSGGIGHDGIGSDLPVIKARGIVPASASKVMELLMDNSRVKEYNKMSQGRKDVYVIQCGLDTSADESRIGLAGEAKIVQILNKPPIIRRNIEMLSLIYARPCDGGGYVAVSRSVWEDDTGTARTSKDTVRSEMHLGVNLVRPLGDDGAKCELTTITHVHTTAVPEYLAKMKAPSHAVGFIKEIQNIFKQ